MGGMGLGLRLRMNSGYSGEPSTPAVNNGLAIVDDSAGNTLVTTASGGGYRIEKVAGGAAYNAAAISSASITGNSLLRIKWIAVPGNIAIGLSNNPTAGDSYDFPGAGIFFDGTTLSSLSYGGIGAFSAPGTGKPYAWVKYVDATDTMEMYAGATSDLGAAGAPIFSFPTYGQGHTWFVDMSINPVGGIVEVLFQ